MVKILNSSSLINASLIIVPSISDCFKNKIKYDLNMFSNVTAILSQ